MVATSARAHSIPVFINCRDRVSDLRVLVNWLECAGSEHIILLDNASTYPPLLEFYKTQGARVHYLGQNLGHHCLFKSGLQPEGPFFLTDPDLVPLGPPEGLEYLWDLSQRYVEYQRIGFGLEMDGATAPPQIIAWEQEFWRPSRQLEPGVFDAPIDTTLALWMPGRTKNGIRTGRPHVMKHSSYFSDYSNRASFSEEDEYYLSHVEGTVSGWAEDIKRYG